MILKLHMYPVFLLIGAFAVFSFSEDIFRNTAPRESFNIGLPRLVVGVSDTNGDCSKVRIIFEGSDDYVVISDGDDMFVEVSRKGSEKKVFRESIYKQYQLSNFEAEQISKVCDAFMDALNGFEKNLQLEKWGRCLYFDGYFPNFLNGFYYLMLKARCNDESVPREAKVADSLFDISMNSIKSDVRVYKWCLSNEYIVSLRIAAKELAYEIDAWQKKDLKNKKRDVNITQDTDFFRSLLFFENLYFNKSNKHSFKK